MLQNFVGNRRDLALLLLRIGLGIIFLAHGVGKLQGGIDGVAGFFGAVGIPAPILMAWIVTLVEVFGGALLIVGLATRLAALLLSIIMIVAILTVKVKVGLIAPMGSGAGAELDLALLVGLLSLLFQGPGAWSADRKLGQE